MKYNVPPVKNCLVVFICPSELYLPFEWLNQGMEFLGRGLINSRLICFIMEIVVSFHSVRHFKMVVNVQLPNFYLYCVTAYIILSCKHLECWRLTDVIYSALLNQMIQIIMSFLFFFTNETSVLSLIRQCSQWGKK